MKKDDDKELAKLTKLASRVRLTEEDLDGLDEPEAVVASVPLKPAAPLAIGGSLAAPSQTPSADEPLGLALDLSLDSPEEPTFGLSLEPALSLGEEDALGLADDPLKGPAPRPVPSSAQRPAQGSAQDSAQGSAAGYAQAPALDPTKVYATVPNQDYAIDPNQDYAIDPDLGHAQGPEEPYYLGDSPNPALSPSPGPATEPGQGRPPAAIRRAQGPDWADGSRRLSGAKRARGGRLTRSRPSEADTAPPKGPGVFSRLARAFLWAGAGLAVLGLAVALLAYAYLAQDLPSVEVLKAYQPKTVTFFYSQDGEIIGEYSHERRLVRPLNEIPLIVRQAFIAAEDSNFYQHGGVNALAMLRAAYNNLKSDRLQGASTITQQVVRSFFLTREKKLTRKLKEIILAFRLEGTLSKDEILYLYLNQIYLGQGAYGVEAAAQAYFDKPVDRLSVAEAAMLAGVTQSPEGKNPIKQPQEARARQVYGIRRMVESGFITQKAGQAALAEILNLVGERPNPNLTVAPYFTEHVRRLLAERFGEESLYNDGWRVFTTLDSRAQRAA
ncbi:MAG: transglycosylase domain-containing protein, partial [Deltaproteobacteria bacterium]|nr:transglycosylase domain-containing protein [Deltaproteobacteria bacterium]